MPVTWFHLGPALMLALIFRLNLFIVAISSIISDIEPLSVELLFLFGVKSLPQELYATRGHVYLHSFIIAIIIAAVIAVVAKRFFKEDFRDLLASALLGIFSHVCLDSFSHEMIMPLFPLSGNPFFLANSEPYLTGFCLLSYFLSLKMLLPKIPETEKQISFLLKLFSIFMILSFLWILLNPKGYFGFSTFGLTTYSGVPIPYFDVKIYGNGLLQLREKSHFISLEEVKPLMKDSEVLILGIGYDKAVKVDERIFKSGIEVISLRSDKAIEKFNELKKKGKRVAAIIHSTC